MNSPRRRAREAALKALYQADLVDTHFEEAVNQVLSETVYRPVFQTVASEFLKGSKAKQILSGEIENFIPGFSGRFSSFPLLEGSDIGLTVKEELEKYFPGLTYDTDSEDEVNKLMTTAETKLKKLKQVEQFSRDLVTTTCDNLKQIDTLLEQYAKNWSIDRMASIDRCILRFATCEILFYPAIPTGASINEAVEIAKKFSAERSYEFVNGILDKIAREQKNKKEELDQTAV